MQEIPRSIRNMARAGETVAPLPVLSRLGQGVLNLSEGRYWAYVLLVPSLLLILAVVIYPILWGMGLSFREMRLNRPDLGTGFVGLKHYAQLLHDPVFWLSLKNTAVWVVGAVAGELLIGLAAALALNRGLPGASFSACSCCSPGSCPMWWPAICGR